MLPNVLRPNATDHVPVLAEEVREALAVQPGETVVDATFGAGGHSELLAAAESIWWELDPPDWHEAFEAHPRIGEKPSSSWAREEQAGATTASKNVMQSLAQVNNDYEKKFGYIFIICATGKGADEMLATAQRRMQNAPDQELRIAAEEQLKITKLRLMKLVS